MDQTKRQIAKIAREVNKFTAKIMTKEALGISEYDMIHLIRHNKGMRQIELRQQLGIDKGACAKRIKRLEEKGYLVTKPNPEDGRSMLVYPTTKAESFRDQKAECETIAYQYLLEDLPKKDQDEFCRILDEIYQRSKKESRSGFPNLMKRIEGKNDNENS